jgi:hypothetical protein
VCFTRSRERLVSISSLVEDPYLFTADLRSRSRSNSISAYDFTGAGKSPLCSSGFVSVLWRNLCYCLVLDMGLPHLGLPDGLSGGIPALNGYFDKYDSEDHVDPYMHPDYTAAGHELAINKKPTRSRQRYKGPAGSGSTPDAAQAAAAPSPPSRRRTNQICESPTGFLRCW